MAKKDPVLLAAETWLNENPGKTLSDYYKATGYDGPKLKTKQKKGQPAQVGYRTAASTTGPGAKRAAALKAEELKYLETLKKLGYSDADAKTMLKESLARTKNLERQRTTLNQEAGEKKFSLGHRTAAIEGGGDFGRNTGLELASNNYSRGASDETPDSVKPLLGEPRSGRGGVDTALMDSDPELFETGLTPQDKQRIRANPELADDIMAERQAILKANPKAKIPRKPGGGFIKTAKGITRFIPTPIDDLIVGTAVAGTVGAATLLTGGGAAQAADNTKNTFLDFATGDLDGGPVADGTGGDDRTAIELERARNSEMPNLLNPPGLVDEKRNQERLELEERARQARERGGRVTIGAGKASFTLPEFGLSELFGFN